MTPAKTLSNPLITAHNAFQSCLIELRIVDCMLILPGINTACQEMCRRQEVANHKQTDLPGTDISTCGPFLGCNLVMVRVWTDKLVEEELLM